jgi:hypothetical protein
MTQAFQLLTVVVVGAGLALFGHFKGREERSREQHPKTDPRQQPLFPRTEPNQHPELVTR